MENTGNKKHKFGLIGRNISYSFSRGYFTKKFEAMGLPGYSYENYDLPEITGFPSVIKQHTDLVGLNVTIPYKEAVIPYLDRLDPEAASVGAVNTVKCTSAGLVGYNTDVYGFQKALEPFLKKHHTHALVLGTGGASKAVSHVLKKLGVTVRQVSRSPGKGQLAYDELTAGVMGRYLLIINCTPLGTYPNIEDRPPLPYELLGPEHILFDLIYNPEVTAFMKAGRAAGAETSNGLRMLELQAERSWEIWNS